MNILKLLGFRDENVTTHIYLRFDYNLNMGRVKRTRNHNIFINVVLTFLGIFSLCTSKQDLLIIWFVENSVFFKMFLLCFFH